MELISGLSFISHLCDLEIRNFWIFFSSISTIRQTSRFLFWDQTKQNYIPVSTEETQQEPKNEAEPTTTVTPAPDPIEEQKSEKAKKAKKIAKVGKYFDVFTMHICIFLLLFIF